MKTSNNILIASIVVVFAVPFLFAYSIKSKMKKGEYTVEKQDQPKNADRYSGTFTAFKVVKVVGPGAEHLRCNLKVSNEMKYSYNNYWKQKIEVVNSNDTLVIKYQPVNQQLHDQVVYINLPAFNTLIVDGASVTIDSLGTDSNLNITLKNGAVVRDGTKSRGETVRVKQPASEKNENIAQSTKAVKAKSQQLHAATFKGTDLELSTDIRDTLIYRLIYRI